MGEGILQILTRKFRKESKIAFFSTFAVALLIHLYKFANTLPNHDSLYNFYSDQNVLGSGRWALSAACAMSSFYDLPWLNGVMSCIFIALTAVIIAALFKLKNPILIGLSGALLAASPATTETFFFMYTADGYMVAMFLAALAVYISRMGTKGWPRYVLSGLCICVSCGIYQAYVSFAMLLALCHFIDELLRGEYSKKQYWLWALRQAAVYVAALAAYYVIWKLFMRFSGTAANNYLGISEVGKISPELIYGGLINAIRTTVIFFLQWNVFKHGLTMYSALNIIFVVLMALGIVAASVKSGLAKKPYAIILLALSLLAMIPAACIWFFTSESMEYRVMMLHSYTLLFVLGGVIYERWMGPKLKDAMCIVLLVMVINNAVLANISYFYLNLCYERSYAEGVEMMCDIHDYQDEYEINRIAIVGDRSGDIGRQLIDPETGRFTPAGQIQTLNGFTAKSLLTNAEHILPFLRNVYGMDIKSATNAVHAELAEMEEVKAMGLWPAADSISVIEDILVIKIGN